MKNLEKIFFKTLRIRMIEEAIAKRYHEQEMRCPVHLSIGQELNAVILCEALEGRDYMFSTHRGHAHYLAKGGSLRGLLCEIYGKAEGCSNGMGGSMHLCDRSVNFLGSTSIVAGTVPVGVGSAFSAKMRGDDRLTVICIGDAAVEEGVFWESYNFARLHNLNVLFFNEDNGYSCYTHKMYRQVELLPEGIRLSELYGVNNDLPVVRQGVSFITIFTDRKVEHCGPNNDDHLGYRIQLARSDAFNSLSKKFALSTINDMRELIQKEIEAEFVYAKQASFPYKKDLGRYVYA